MASSVLFEENEYEYLNYSDTRNNLNSVCINKTTQNYFNLPKNSPEMPSGNVNIIHKLTNREILGKFSSKCCTKSKQTSLFKQIHHGNKFLLGNLLDFDASDKQFLNHIYMGFTVCGQYFISYKENLDCGPNLTTLATYELFVWRFVPGKRFSFISKHKVFKLHTGAELSDFVFMQHPTEIYKLYCYAVSNCCTPAMAYLTILTLPIISDNCKLCKSDNFKFDESFSQAGFCLSHGFILHYMFTMSQPIPSFKPSVSLAYPDHIVINTGHHIHILNITCYKHVAAFPFGQSTRINGEELKHNVQFTDAMSEVSEMSDSFSANSIVEAILEDFSDYDFETGECTKPFHELNISCEPLNITGKNYHNSIVQNIVDPRLKRLQNKDVVFSVPQTSGVQKSEKPKIDRNIAEKAYEFTEENEKCEKLSSFRKKRLADKKYEFSEDNSENIVPFHLLRRERRYLFKSKSIKSPELTSLFLSPRSQGRSPMQSPNSRGEFSPAGRNIYCPALRNSPHHSKSPISPREYARKFNVYSPSLDSDCSDNDSKLVLRQINNLQNDSTSKVLPPMGLLIVDSKKDESQKWIKKVVRRYSSGDFENSSLVSGQSRDDYNMPIEIPILVQTLTDQQLDVIPEFKSDLLANDTQLIVTQRSFDCEQFVHSRAQKLCTEHELQFLHCEDYDVELVHICPLEGYIVCQAVIKIGAVKMMEAAAFPKLHSYEAQCLFTWNILTNSFDLIEPSDEQCRFQLYTASCHTKLDIDIPQINCKPVLTMDVNVDASKYTLRDYENQYEIDLGYEHESWGLDSETSVLGGSISDID